MQGLRTQENKNFKNYFRLVQEKAKKQGKVFFLDSGDCVDLVIENMELDNLDGWFIDIEKANEFEKDFVNFKSLDKWDDFYTNVSFQVKDNKEILINFN